MNEAFEYNDVDELRKMYSDLEFYSFLKNDIKNEKTPEFTWLALILWI